MNNVEGTKGGGSTKSRYKCCSGAHRAKNKRIMEPNKGFGLGLSWLIKYQYNGSCKGGFSILEV